MCIARANPYENFLAEMEYLTQYSISAKKMIDAIG